MRNWLAPLVLTLTLTGAAVHGVAADPPASGPVDLRSDQGLMMEFRPGGVAWLGPDRLLMCDLRFNDFHIFDLTGRRFRECGFPRNSIPIAQFSALTPFDENSWLAAGSHNHEKNNVRYVEARSVIYKIGLEGDGLANWIADNNQPNYSPDRALRATGNFGESPRHPLFLQGLAIDPKQKRVYFGCSEPYNKKDEVLIYEGKLDPFLAQDKTLELKETRTDLKPETDPATGNPYRIGDMVYVPTEGLMLLLFSQSGDGRSFGSNQLWILRGGFPPPRLIMKDIAPGNRGSGLAVRHVKDHVYDVAITFDNDPDETQTPSRLLVLPGVKL